MEIRANHALVGFFTLLILFAAGMFVLWIGGPGRNTPKAQYEIVVKDSVRGLSINSDVLFSGIRVGNVTDIRINRDAPGEVFIRISIEADTPVREGSAARLDVHGITGMAVVFITAGSTQSPLLRPLAGEVATIRYEPSPMASAVHQVPNMLSSSFTILRRAEQLLAEENVQAVNDILVSLAQISRTLADRSDSINAILLETEKISAELGVLIGIAHEVLGEDMKQTSVAISGVARRADSALAAMEPGLRQFSTQGLADFRMLLVELRNLAHVFTRVGQKLESDPRGFLFGDTVQEYHNR